MISCSVRDHSVYTDGQTDGQTHMARSTRLVILVKNIYTSHYILLPVTYFLKNLVYPFILRVTGIFNLIINLNKNIQMLKQIDLHC